MPVDAGGLGARQHAGAVGGERVEIEMAVAVDQHGSAGLGRARTCLNTGSGAGSTVPAASRPLASSACCSSRWSAGTPSRSSIFAAEAGTNG